MNTDATFEKLRTMRLHGFAQAYREITESTQVKNFTLDEIIAHLIEAEYEDRYNRKLKRLVRQARFRQQASFEQINFDRPRGMDKNMLLRLQQGDWINKSRDIIITGPTGVGKSFIACALGFQACAQEFRTIYFTANKLLDRMTLTKADGSYFKFMDKMAKTKLLIIDDFGLKPLKSPHYEDLHDLIDERYEQKSTIITSNLDFSEWGQAFPNKLLGAATLDRLRHNAYRLVLEGESYRKLRENNNQTGRGAQSKK